MPLRLKAWERDRFHVKHLNPWGQPGDLLARNLALLGQPDAIG
jgi:hypothetical protein